MANYARLELRFIGIPSENEGLHFDLKNIDTGVSELSIFEVAKLERWSPNQFEIDSSGTFFGNAISLESALNADYLNLISISRNLNTVIIEANNNGYYFEFLTGDLIANNKIDYTIVNEVQPDPQFAILSTTPQPPQTLPVCDNQRVKLTVENGAPPFTINSEAGTKSAANESELWVELPRYLPGEITLTDDNGASDSVTPDSVRTWAIAQVSVEESQSGATITIKAETLTTGTALNYQYSLDGSNWQTSNNFTGILPGDGLAWVRDSFTCIKTQPFTVEGLETPRPEPNFTIEKANPLRFIDAASPEFSNVENTLYNEQENTNIEKYYFRQPWQSGSIVRTQIKTSYRDLVAKVYDCDNELTDEIVPEKKVTNIGQQDKRDAYVYYPGGEYSIVYFPQGNIYDVLTDQVINRYNSRGELPNFASEQIIIELENFTADQLAGTYSVKEIIYNKSVGYWGLKIELSGLTPEINYFVIATSTFNAEIYDIFEFSFSKTTGQYRVEIEATDENSNYQDLLHVSEPIFFDELEKVVTIQYSSEDNQSGINYQTGIQFLLNIPGRLFNYSQGGEDESFTDDLGNKIIQKSVYVQQRELQTGLIPDWLAEKIVIASTHENFKINGLELTMTDRPEIESKSENNNPLYVLTCIYQLKNKIARDEQVGIVSSSRAVIGADAGAVLGV